jgi:ATP-dependent DNA ligase
MGKTGDPGWGIALRFPRYEQSKPNKKLEQATTSDQILEMYQQQDKDDGYKGDDENGI